jgi:uncharacterized Fe-S center protein
MRSISATTEHSITGKFDAIVKQLGLKDAVKDKRVVIKMHVGNLAGITTVHPFLVRRLVDVIRDGGGQPYIVDIMEQHLEGFEREIHWRAVKRGYTSEVLGCSILPVSGPADDYYVEKEVNYKGLKTIRMGGLMKDAEVLVGLAHFKGHNAVGYGGAIKNLALGCFTYETRLAMHRTQQWDKYWDKDKSKDAERLVKSCPFGCISYKQGKLKVDFDMCNQCMRCIAADTDGCIQIKPENFESFPEINAIATQFVLSHFDERSRFFINVATDITEYCDCWGFTTGEILPDLGILGSQDLVALDKACLDLLADKPLVKENVSQDLEVNDDPGLHPFARIHGPYRDPYTMIRLAEKHRLGSSNYELEEVLPPIPQPVRAPAHFPRVQRKF